VVYDLTAIDSYGSLGNTGSRATLSINMDLFQPLFADPGRDNVDITTTSAKTFALSPRRVNLVGRDASVANAHVANPKRSSVSAS
jgi:hypothetical protein